MCGWEWFPNNKGFVSGIIVAGFGFGAFIFGFISTFIVNPYNLQIDKKNGGYFPKQVSDNIPLMYKLLLFVWAIFVLIAGIGVKRNP